MENVYQDMYPYFPDKNTLIEIMDNSFGTIFVTDKDGKIIFFSENQVRQNLQLEPEELLHVNVKDMQKLGLTDKYAVCAKTLQTKEINIEKVRNSSPNGNIYTDRIVVAQPVFDENGELKLVVAYSMEEEILNSMVLSLVHEKEKSETALSYIFQQELQTSPVVRQDPVTTGIYKMANKVAKLDTTVLITGESGTGKEVMAKYLHSHSNRANKIFLPVNSAALPNELIESELFGYEKGSFTGANKSGKPGLFEIANDGTIFLDEIGEIPYATQSKLLRVLENGEYYKIGGSKVNVTNARIIAATNKDLLQMVHEGKFREDLYYRLNIVPISIPPLRSRKNDIKYLANFFLEQLNNKYKTKHYFSNIAISAFMNYEWPGNVRELKNVVERLALMVESDEIGNDVYSYINFQPPSNSLPETPSKPSVFSYGTNFKEAVKAFEKEYIEAVISQCGGNMTAAAKELQLHRTSLYKKLALED